MSVAEAPSRGSREAQSSPQVVRLLTIAVIVAVVALSAFADRSAKKPAARAVVASVMPVAAPAAALSSSWFCAGPASSPAHLADGRLVIANAGSGTRRGKVTVVPSVGGSVTQDLQVGPTDRVVVPEKTATPAPYLGALVQLDGGQASVQQVVTGTAGTSSTACVTTGSNRWYFAAGTTQESSTLSISLFNPYPDDAIADLSFTTEQGRENPQDFQGIVIPASSVVGFDLGSHLRRRASVATTVTLRVGRVAAFETETVQAQSQAAAATAPQGSTPWPPGVSVVAGAPSAGPSWWWPGGAPTDGATEQYVIYNPGAKPAQVALGIDLDQGSADPFQVSVGPFGAAVVATNVESRIPKGVGHGAWLRSTNGVGVVAERLVLASASASGTSSSPTGVAVALGSRLQSVRWLVPGDGSTDPVNQALAVYNPGLTAITVSISALDGTLTTLDGQAAVSIPAHHRYLLAGSAVVRPLEVAVRGAGQVVVEGDISPGGRAIGIDASVGVPLGP